MVECFVFPKTRLALRLAEFTPAFLEPPLSADGGLGYQGRVVALVSPGCMSACDRLAGMLQRGHRAVLVGGATEGAGASQQVGS